LRTEAEIQKGQELQGLLFDGSEIASFASSSLAFTRWEPLDSRGREWLEKTA